MRVIIGETFLRFCLRQGHVSFFTPSILSCLHSIKLHLTLLHRPSFKSPCLIVTAHILRRTFYTSSMSQRRSRAPSRSDDDSSGFRAPPPPQADRDRRSRGDDYDSPKRRRRHSGRGYDMPREKPLPSKVELQMCVFHGAPSHRWRTAPFVFDRRRDDDRELWEEIRHVYRDELQGVWRRILGFKKLKKIIPIQVPTPLFAMYSSSTPRWCGAKDNERMAQTGRLAA